MSTRTPRGASWPTHRARARGDRPARSQTIHKDWNRSTWLQDLMRDLKDIQRTRGAVR